jgi:hypothetical protein
MANPRATNGPNNKMLENLKRIKQAAAKDNGVRRRSVSECGRIA